MAAPARLEEGGKNGGFGNHPWPLRRRITSASAAFFACPGLPLAARRGKPALKQSGNGQAAARYWRSFSLWAKFPPPIRPVQRAKKRDRCKSARSRRHSRSAAPSGHRQPWCRNLPPPARSFAAMRVGDCFSSRKVTIASPHGSAGRPGKRRRGVQVRPGRCRPAGYRFRVRTIRVASRPAARSPSATARRGARLGDIGDGQGRRSGTCALVAPSRLVAQNTGQVVGRQRRQRLGPQHVHIGGERPG